MNNPKVIKTIGKVVIELGTAYYSGYFFEKGKDKAKKEKFASLEKKAFKLS